MTEFPPVNGIDPATLRVRRRHVYWVGARASRSSFAG
jgi:hypothetical protein